MTTDDGFLQWFERTFRRPFPVVGFGAGMTELAPDLWASDGTFEQVSGFPHALWVSGNPTHRVVGFRGHGMNSYAGYFTDIAPGSWVLLRMFFGGVYGDTERDSARLVEEIAAVHAVTRELRSLGLFFLIVENMGDLHVGVGRQLPELREPDRSREVRGRLAGGTRAFEKHFSSSSAGDAAFWNHVLAEAKLLALPR